MSDVRPQFDPVAPPVMPGVRAPRRSLRRNFGWALVGNGIFQGSQMLMIVAVANLLSPADVGRFVLALAIGAPLIMLARLQLRAVQVTDVDDVFDFGHFLALRLVTLTAALVCIAGLALAIGENREAMLVIAIIGLSKAVIALRDTFTSYQQKHERLDLVATSQTLHGLLALVGLTLAAYWTGSLAWGVALMAAMHAFVTVIWDMPAARRLAISLADPGAFRPVWKWRTLFRLAWLALPLGLASLVMTINVNTPRYLIEAFMDSEALGYFGAIAALPVAGSMVIQAAGTAALPRLSRHFRDSRRAYTRLVIKLIGLAGLLGLTGVMVAALFGSQILGLIFGESYAAYGWLFVWLMVFGALSYITNLFGVCLMAAKRFRTQLGIYSMVLGVTLAFGVWLIPTIGLIGAAVALIFGRVFQILCYVFVLVMATRSSSPATGAEAGPVSA